MRTRRGIPPMPAQTAIAILLGLLAGCQTAAFRVVDASTRRPVAGAEVEHGYIRDPGLAVFFSGATYKAIPLEVLRADADGRLVVRNVQAAHYLFVTAPEYTRTEAYYEFDGWHSLVGRLERRDGYIMLPLHRPVPCTLPVSYLPETTHPPF